MEHLLYEFDAGPHDVIEVTVDRQANVLLLDTHNYHNYSHGRRFNYHGGLAQKSPVLLSPPREGHWYVVIDLGGRAGHIRHSARLIKNAA